jgi:hypothetical protein
MERVFAHLKILGIHHSGHVQNMHQGQDHLFLATACERKGQRTVTVAMPQGKSFPLTVMVPPFQLMGLGITPDTLGRLP